MSVDKAGTNILCPPDPSISYHLSPSRFLRLINFFPTFPLHLSFHYSRHSDVVIDDLKKVNFWATARIGILAHNNPTLLPEPVILWNLGCIQITAVLFFSRNLRKVLTKKNIFMPFITMYQV
jgi:hypothetical protein